MELTRRAFEAEVLDLANGVALAVLVQEGRPVASAAEVHMRYGAVIEWADGVMVRIKDCADPDEARAAAERLAEEGG